jgi:hypothetical protein
VLSDTGLYVVGSRLSHGTLKTPKKVIPDQPTRTLLLAGSLAGLEAFAKLTTTPPAAAKTEWNDLRRFSAISVPHSEKVIVRRPELAEGEVITWESVLTPIGQVGRERDQWMDDCFAKWVAWVEGLGGEIATDYRRKVGDLTFVPVALHGKRLIGRLSSTRFVHFGRCLQFACFPKWCVALRCPSSRLRLPRSLRLTL